MKVFSTNKSKYYLIYWYTIPELGRLIQETNYSENQFEKSVDEQKVALGRTLRTLKIIKVMVVPYYESDQFGNLKKNGYLDKFDKLQNQIKKKFPEYKYVSQGVI